VNARWRFKACSSEMYPADGHSRWCSVGDFKRLAVLAHRANIPRRSAAVAKIAVPLRFQPENDILPTVSDWAYYDLEKSKCNCSRGGGGVMSYTMTLDMPQKRTMAARWIWCEMNL